MLLRLKHAFVSKKLLAVMTGLLMAGACLFAQQVEEGQRRLEEAKAKAERGEAESQAQLGGLYAEGRVIEKDFVEAYAWLNLASRLDEKAAKQRDDLEVRMTPQQVADGQKRTKELRTLVENKKQSGSSVTNVLIVITETNQPAITITPNGAVRETYIGGSIFKEEHKRVMRTAIGTKDIFGRKESAGYTELRFQGITSDGLIILQLTEVETESNIRSRTSQVQIGNTRGVIIRPANELPPNTTQFTFDPAKETELAIAGYRVRFLEFTQQKLKFSYAK